MVARTWIKLTSSGSFTLPIDWNPLDNTIEGIGSGSYGLGGSSTFGGSGGKGGCYAKITNFTGLAGAVIPIQVGLSTGTLAQLDTTFGSVLVAKGAQTTTFGCVGQIVFPGGAGAPGVASNAGSYGGGGGGAGGPNGAGEAGSGPVGGRGDAGAGGAGGGSSNGAPGNEWPGLAGSGGGGGDGGAATGFAGGAYGGAGAGGGCAGSLAHSGGEGAWGVIVISYTPLIVGSSAMAEAPDSSVFVGVDFWAAALAASEAGDSASMAGLQFWGARLAASEAPDSASFSVGVIDHGALAVTEAGDAAALVVTIDWRPALAAIEAPDVALFNALAFYANTMAASEDGDTAFMQGLVAAFGPMAAREDFDSAAMTAQSGSLWPPIFAEAEIVEAGDVGAFLGLTDALGHLEFYGAGASILYPAASALERAMADVEVAHMMALPARRITENLDPWKVQAGDNLIFLAYGMGATLWEDSWSELTKREWVDNQWKFKSLVGFLPAYKMALGASGYDIVQVVKPPGGFFVAPDLTVDQTNAWIRKMPEIRVTFESKTAVEGIDEIFADDGYIDQDYVGENDGRALYGRFAYLRKDGVDSPIAIVDGADGLTETISIPQIDHNSFFVNDSFVDDSIAAYALDDQGPSNVYSFKTDDFANVATSELAMTALAAGLTPLEPKFEIESDIEIDTAPSAFADDWTPDIDYVTPDNGPMLLASVLHLLDPAIAAPMTAAASFVDDARIDIPSDYAELTIDCHVALSPLDLVADDGFCDSDVFYVDEDLSALDRTCRAIVSAKALRDTILINFTGTPLVIGPPAPPSWEPGHGIMQATEDEDVALFRATPVISGVMAAIEDPDVASYVNFAVLRALEGGDVCFATGEANFVIVVMVAIEGADVASASGSVLSGNGFLAATEGADTFVGVGAVKTVGVLAATEGADSFSAAASSANVAVLAVTEGSDQANAAGSIAWAAAMQASEGADVAAAAGAIVTAGALSVVEAPDIAFFSAGGFIAGVMAAIETGDQANAAALAAWNAALAITEAPDQFLGSAAAIVVGAVQATETPDAAAAAGLVYAAASLVATEGADTAAFAGAVITSGAMAAAEGADSCFATISPIISTALMAAREDQDIGGGATTFYSDGIIFVQSTDLAIGSVYWSLTSAVTEAPDIMTSAGGAAWQCAMAAAEGQDSAAAHGSVLVAATMAALESPDVANFQAGGVLLSESGEPIIAEGTINYYTDGVFFFSDSTRILIE